MNQAQDNAAALDKQIEDLKTKISQTTVEADRNALNNKLGQLEAKRDAQQS